MQSYPVASNGFNIIRSNYQDTGYTPGGSCIEYTAAVALKLGDSVHLVSGTGKVTKTTSAGDHGRVAGVVVGGANTGMQAVDDSSLVDSLVVADIDEPVLVLFNGIFYIIAGGSINEGDRIVLDTGTAGRVKVAAAIAAAAAGLGTLAVAGAPAIGTLAVGGAPDIGTLDAEVDSGSTPVTSSAANGAIATVTGAPGIGTLAVTGAPAIGTLALSGALAAAAMSGDGAGTIFGKMLQAATVGQIKLALINV